MKHTFTGRVAVPLYKTAPSGFGSVRSGVRIATINLQVDVDQLISHLGGKAARSKGRKSRIQGDMITAEAVAIEDNTLEGKP